MDGFLDNMIAHTHAPCDMRRTSLDSELHANDLTDQGSTAVESLGARARSCGAGPEQAAAKTKHTPTQRHAAERQPLLRDHSEADIL